MSHLPSDLRLGDVRLDEHHTFLFSLLDAATKSSPQQLSPVELTSLVKAILLYAVQHFEAEEALMSADGWPLLNQHRTLHTRFKTQCTDLITLGHAGRKTSSGAFYLPVGVLSSTMVLDSLRGYLREQIADTTIGDAAYVIWRRQRAAH